MKGQQVGYIRVSSEGQNTERQLDGLTLDRVFTDKVSGSTLDRPELKLCLDFIRQGDTLNVHSMDRLSRNLVDLLNLVKKLTEKGISIKFHKENLTFTGENNPIQTLQLQILGSVAQFERSMIKERQKEGIQVAQTKGTKFGRPSKLTLEQENELIFRVDNGESKTELSKEYGVSRATLYNYIKSTK